jgi:hypothetical protein
MMACYGCPPGSCGADLPDAGGDTGVDGGAAD